MGGGGEMSQAPSQPPSETKPRAPPREVHLPSLQVSWGLHPNRSPMGAGSCLVGDCAQDLHRTTGHSRYSREEAR